MPFTSYAQNFEDVMLWRALRHVDKGCYIDVGAQHPVVDSVSKAFYEHGWRGIHVEPVPQYANLLRADRPDETVLQLALSDTEGVLELNLIPETGLSTGVENHAQRHQSERGLGFQKISVPVTTLSAVASSLSLRDVHWLKIDVEGFETQVLKGWNSRTLRPWIMVLEATIPNSPETDYADWEPILMDAGYQFVYFDGLNRYYVASEHSELAKSFAAPPNVFDDLVLTADSPICRELVVAHRFREEELLAKIGAQAEKQVHLEARATMAETRALRAEEQAALIESRLNSVLSSRSWRLTRPLRWITRQMQRSSE